VVSRPPARAALLAVLLCLLVGGWSGTAEGAARIAVGGFSDGADAHPNRISALGRLLGRKPVIINSYKHWGDPAFVRSQLRAVWRHGAVTMVTWEPWDGSGRGYSLRAIARGRHDGYVRRTARAARRWGKPVLLRFAHEMNGSWVPWGSGVNGNRPRHYRAAWRHVVSIFRRQRAGNVRWVWSPYVSNGRLPLKSLYPGDRWVDWAALDGFNWGASRGWQPFTKVFNRSYRALARFSSRPIMIAEVGSGELGGSKASWLRRALRRALPRLHRVRALVWFDARIGDSDFRVNSSPSALAALRRGLRKPLYGSSRRRFLRTPRRFARQRPAPAEQALPGSLSPW
jgi:hypothetical protein